MPLNHRILIRGFFLVLCLSIFIPIARYLYEALSKSWNTSPFATDPYNWEPAYSGWYNRSIIINDTTDIHLKASDLILVSTSSAWGEEGFNLAFFKPDLCITSHAALRMNQTDLIGIENLVQEAANIKTTFYNMAPNVFDLITEHLWLFKHGSPTTRYNAYAFSEYGVPKGADHMPRALCELFRLVGDGPWYLESGGEDLKRLLAEVEKMIDRKI